ncbi:MAG: class I SAM-dependent methyltransferase [Oligoflexia bacterium]|nr:class I SAM-dependent methyltransferase [Oligoflexia bacterium]
MNSINQIAKQVCPPVIWQGLKGAKRMVVQKINQYRTKEGTQDLDPYWEEKMAQILEVWGEGNVWNEICMFMFQREGKVLDIACGTGKSSEILKNMYPKLDIYGCDISDLLIKKAVDRGFAKEKFVVCDATKMDVYTQDQFDYSFTIGSLEHFSLEGIDKLIAETKRIVKNTSFHMMPTSKSGKDEGWLKTYQSFYNNSPHWWVNHFKKHFNKVLVFDSKWEDDISVGKWFVTIKD